MLPTFARPQLLDPRYLHDLWRVLWFGIAIAVIFNTAFGGLNDWIRLLVYAPGVFISQRVARTHPVQALVGYALFSFVMFAWMNGDPTGVLQNLSLGVPAYGFFSMCSVLVMGIHLGPVGAALGVFAAGPLMHLMLFSPQWPFVWLQLTVGALLGSIIHKLFKDLKQSEAKLEQAAMTDALTGLENRRALPIAFERYQALSKRQNQPLLLTEWDINDLKHINDTQGHAAGDAYLQAFVEALKLESRAEDVFFRIGGDEFVGLHFGLESAQHLRDRVHARFPNVAVGWCVALEDLDATLKAADDMMYAAKKVQKNLALANA